MFLFLNHIKKSVISNLSQKDEILWLIRYSGKDNFKDRDFAIFI